MSELVKYPRTPHLPFSPGRTADDILLETIDHLTALREIVVTEKMDGENTTLYRDYLHARSLTYVPHASRTWIAQYHAAIKHEIPEQLRICGENLYARHSIFYNALPSYFLVFAIFENDICLSWDETTEWCALLGLHTVPILYRGPFDMEAIRHCWTGVSRCGGEQEGYVVRNAEAFPYEGFPLNVAKFVRADHVTSEEHWMQQELVRNRLAPGDTSR